MTSQEMMRADAKPGYWWVNVSPIDEPQNWEQQVAPLQPDNKLFGYGESEFLAKQYRRGK